ncbi:MAG: DEAD/DEAH box helicase [Verrucomicrobia bacterium]|nr:DEAD/DEAH box helicase [Verrucomicrobiota bacterium]
MKLFSKQDLVEGKHLLEEGRVKGVLFSEGTYQVEVLARPKPKETFWPFLQLHDSGELIDAFCTCEKAEKKGSCPHLAAAYSKIMQQEPLHVRFRESFWNQIGMICAERHGYEASCLKRSHGAFEAFSQTGKRLFWMKPKRKLKEFEEVLYHRPIETEETSLKFSKLDPEELTLWREGRPSAHLSYELSFWSDLAKQWMLYQEDGVAYKILFSDEELPHFISIDFPDIAIEFYLDLSHWPQVIPSLQTVDSPLKVHPYTMGKLESIHFIEGSFVLEFEEKGQEVTKAPEGEKKIPVGDWLYVSGEGFYPKGVDPLLDQKVIRKDQISLFFKRHLKLIQKHLKGEKIHPNPLPVRYWMFFDQKQALHVEAYLFEKGDLEPYYFGDWAYLPEKGFFQLDKQLFDSQKQEIPKEKVSDFVNRHRLWLQSFEGFQTHVSGVESKLGFKFNGKGRLIFFTRHEFTEEGEQLIDLGEWIYVKGKGFYAKIAARAGSFVKAGVEVEPFEVSSFIHRHRDELEPVPGFFTDHCPLQKSGLNIGFNEKGRIEINPEFFFLPQYAPQKVKIFGDYTYVEGEGFALIPHASRLPESYKVEKVIDPLAEPYFIGYELELLYPHVLTIDPKLKRPQKMGLRLLGLKRQPSAKTGQWVLELNVETDIGAVPIFELWRAIWDGKQYLFSSAGLLFLRKKNFDWLRLKSKKRWLKNGEAIRFNTLEFLRLTATEDLLEPEGESRKAKETGRLLRDLLALKAPTEPDLTGLQSDLRPYQKTGVAWLWFLYSYGLSGMLCDEMGLGKTHQAMALIAAIKNSKKSKFLVVCPTSVIYHWEKLIQTFLPSLKVYVFHGIGRRFEAFSKNSYDLLLTSYGIVRTENKALSKVHFDLSVFDELQTAKNEKSQTNRALRNINATMRLGLTGTPIENRLTELKALFELIVPTYLPTMSVFRELFTNPIEKYQDAEKRELLRRLIHPFLLRRKKSEVLTELPEKIEEVALCDMSEEQHRLYHTLVIQNRDQLLRDLEDTSKPPPITHIFSMLSKLKQICNHPCLITKDIGNYKHHASGKWELFLELLDETRDSGQKLVVFSQYLGMLDIIGSHLKERGISFAEIRGSTRDRKAEVERFAEDPTCEIFLGSLQAAGVGIDLISASVVIHYDRWWNPAKENQATDRVHRMGQKRGVQVFKLVTKNSIEEHIDSLIEKKLSLAKGILSFDDQDQIKGLQREDLIELLQLLEKD